MATLRVAITTVGNVTLMDSVKKLANQNTYQKKEYGAVEAEKITQQLCTIFLFVGFCFRFKIICVGKCDWKDKRKSSLKQRQAVLLDWQWFVSCWSLHSVLQIKFKLCYMMQISVASQIQWSLVLICLRTELLSLCTLLYIRSFDQNSLNEFF